MYEWVRQSGEARIQIIDAVIDRFFDNADYSDLLTAVGLYDDDIAADEAPRIPESEGDAAHRHMSDGVVDDSRGAYARWCNLVADREAQTYGKRRTSISNDPIRLGPARRAVLLRSEGRCENPTCRRLAPDVTDRGDPILEVDHVEQITDGGRDHPIQMIALCPNCHAVKTRGKTRDHLYAVLVKAARERHSQWLGATP
jgi:5-methylcytosine-specific restriction protein A